MEARARRQAFRGEGRRHGRGVRARAQARLPCGFRLGRRPHGLAQPAREARPRTSPPTATGSSASEVYGGVIWHTWLDRELALAGRSACEIGGTRLVRTRRALCRIPNLAIHLDRDVNTAGPQLNAQNHLVPLLGPGREGRQARLCSAWWARARASRPTTSRRSTCASTTPAGQRSAAPTASSCSRRGSTTWPPATPRRARSRAGARVKPPASSRCTTTRRSGSQSAAGAKSRFLASVLERVAGSLPDAGRDATEPRVRALAPGERGHGARPAPQLRRQARQATLHQSSATAQ